MPRCNAGAFSLVPPMYGPQDVTVETYEPSTVPPKLAPLPRDTEALIDWIDEQYPEETPMSSERAVVDAALMRAGIRELVRFLRYRLERDYEEMNDDAEVTEHATA